MVLEILLDKLIHLNKYNYILNLEKLTNVDKDNIRQIIQSKKTFTSEEAQQIAKELGIDFTKEKFDLNQFLSGLDVELEHGSRSPLTNVTNDDPILTGKIALAHLREFPDYYTRLSKLEEEAKAYWSLKR